MNNSNNIKFIFKTIKSPTKILTITSDEVISISTIEKEGIDPILIARFHSISLYQNIKDFDFCEVYKDDKLFFKGIIQSKTNNDDNNNSILEIEFISNTDIDKIKISTTRIIENTDIISNFRYENPDILTSIDITETLMSGDKVNVSLLKADAESKNMDHKIIKDSLKIKIDKSNEISDVDLEISGSWISDINGEINITNKISNKFKEGVINTLTPEKLIDSWPSTFDRLSISKGFNNNKSSENEESNSKLYKNTTQTKYYIGYSRIDLDKKTSLNLNILKDIDDVKINKSYFDHKLILAWGYEQFMTESIKLNIINKFASRKNKKHIKINLKNIQEYIENPEDQSFFNSKNGKSIILEILNNIANSIALSMRNIEISFNTILDEETINLNCSNWINIKGYNLKISHIERFISGSSSYVKVKAAGLEAPLPLYKDFIKDTLDFNIQNQRGLNESDIIHSINVCNEAESQYEKLLQYINELKSKKEINKSNYQRLITKFLNENQTIVQIIAKPLKTKHCEKKEIIIKDPIYFIGEK